MTQEVQLLKEELQNQQHTGKRDPGNDKLASVGSVRKDKELRQLQGDYELLKAEVEKLRSENAILKSERSVRRSGDLPIAVKESFSPAAHALEEDKEKSPAEGFIQSPQKPAAEDELAGSLGNSTLKSELCDLTKSQKLLIENVIIVSPRAFITEKIAR